MRKRKISLVLILAFSLLALLFVYGGSYLVAQKIESEVDRLFPEIATRSKVEGLNFSYKEGLRIENFYMEMGTDIKQSSATGKDIHASINWSGFIFSGGKLRINSLYMSSFSVSINKSFESLINDEVENIVNEMLDNILKRETISTTFSLRIDEFYIVDSTDKVLKLRPIQFSRKKNKELSLFISEAAIDSTTAFRYLKIELEDFSFSDSLSSLVNSIDKSVRGDLLTHIKKAGETLLLDTVSVDQQNYLNFKRLKVGLGIVNVSTGILDSLYGFDLTLEKGENGGVIVDGKIQELYSAMDTLNGALLKASIYDTIVIFDTLDIDSRKGGSYRLSGRMGRVGKRSKLNCNIYGLKSSIAKDIFPQFPKGIKGKLSLEGRMEGQLLKPESWEYEGAALIEQFQLRPVGKFKKLSHYMTLPIQMDSLVLDSIVFNPREIQVDLSRSIEDTGILVPFRPYPVFSKIHLNRATQTVQIDTIAEFAVKHKGREHKISAGGLQLEFDSLGTDVATLKSCNARSVDVATAAGLVSPKGLKQIGIPPLFSSISSLHIGKLEIRDRKRRVHPDTLGYYYPTLLTGAGLSYNKKGKKGEEHLFCSLDSLVIPKQGRLSHCSVEVDPQNSEMPLYQFHIKEGFLHEKVIPLKKKLGTKELKEALLYFPKSKGSIDNLTIQNDSTTLAAIKKMRINYVNDSLYNFSYTSLFQKGFASLKGGKGRLVKAGRSIGLQKGSFQSITVHSALSEKQFYDQYKSGVLQKQLAPFLPSGKISVENFRIKKSDTVTVSVKKASLQKVDSTSFSISFYQADLYKKILCKWGELTLRNEKRGSKLKKVDIAQLKLLQMEPLVLRKGGQSFSKKMISQFNRSFALLDRYIDTAATVSIKSCKGDIKDMGEFSSSNILLKTGKKRSEFSSLAGKNITYPGFDRITSFNSNFKRHNDRWVVDSLKLVSGDNTRLFASGYVKPVGAVPCSLSLKIENFKLSNIQKHYFKNSDAKIRGGAYGQLKLTGHLFNRKSWRAKRASVTLLNASVENLPLQKGEKITKYAPTFRKLKFSKMVINPVDLNKGNQIHVKYLEAKSDKLDFTGWGSLDFKGRFYFEMKGRVHKEDADALPRLTRMALNEASKTEYGKFYAKLYGDTKKQYLVPERGIAGKVIRSQFRKIGAKFRNLFNHSE